MADKVTKADYEALTDAANRFSQESDRIKQIAGRLGRGAENLKRTSWTGKGADAFFHELESSILPMYRRLSDALKEASNIMKALGKLFQDAEQEASATVKGTGGGSALGAAGEAVASALGGALGGAFGGAGGASEGGGIGDAIAAALGGAFGGAFGGAGAAGDAGDTGGTDGGDLESFPGTLQEALQNALGGAGLKPSGNILEIVLKKGEAMADTGEQYGVDQPSGGGGGGGEPTGAPAEAATEPQSTGGGGSGGGGSDSGSGGGGQGGGASMVEGGSVGTPLGAGQGFWFGATPGSRLSSAGAALSAVGISPAAPAAGGNAVSLLASLGASAGAAVLGIVGKALVGKGLKP